MDASSCFAPNLNQTCIPLLLLLPVCNPPFLTAPRAVQSFAEKLFTQLNVRYKKETWETRLAMITVTARVIGVHKLLMDEKYYAAYLNLVQPRQRDITHVLAALIMVSSTSCPSSSLLLQRRFCHLEECIVLVQLQAASSGDVFCRSSELSHQ